MSHLASFYWMGKCSSSEERNTVNTLSLIRLPDSWLEGSHLAKNHQRFSMNSCKRYWHEALSSRLPRLMDYLDYGRFWRTTGWPSNAAMSTYSVIFGRVYASNENPHHTSQYGSWAIGIASFSWRPHPRDLSYVVATCNVSYDTTSSR